MKKFVFVLNVFFIVSVALFGQNGISMSFSPIEGNMSKEFNVSLKTIVEERFSSAGFTLQNDEAGVIATHMLVVSADSWQEEQTSAADIALSVFSALGNVSTSSRERQKEIVEKYRISAKVIDIETTYIVSSGMAQGNMNADPAKLVADLVKDVSKQLKNAGKKKNKNLQFSVACLPPSGSTNHMSVDSKTPYLIAVESAFIDRGDNVGDRNRLETLMQEFSKQYSLSKQLDDPNAESLQVGEVMKINYFASVSVDTWVESKTSGLDVFNAIAGVGIAAATGTAARGMGGEQNRDIVQMVRVTIKVIDIETSYVVAAGVGQGDIGDDPVKLASAAMKDLDKQLVTIEKRKKKMKEDPISVACLPATGSMDTYAKEAYISAIEISLIKNGYKVADRNKLESLMNEISLQRGATGSMIKGDALELGKLMNITHFVTVTADMWEEDETSGLDVFKAVGAAGTSLVTGNVMTSGGGKESLNIVLKTRLGAKVVGISDGILIASGLSIGEMKDKPVKLSDDVLLQIEKQIRKLAKLKEKPSNIFMSCEVSAGNLDKEIANAYILSTERELMEQNIVVIDNSINEHIAGAIMTQRALGDGSSSVELSARAEAYKVNIIMDTWEEQKLSDLSKAKTGLRIGSIIGAVASALFLGTSPNTGGGQVEEDTYVTVINVRCLVQVVDTKNDDIVIFEGRGEGLLKDDPLKLLNKILKGVGKTVSGYHTSAI